MFCLSDKIMDVDDDDEYRNAAAAHAAFVMTVSAASMYWLLRHAQHARDINIYKLHPLAEKIGLGRSADFLHSGTGYIENSRVRSVIDFFADFSQNFSERALLVLKNSTTIIFNHENRHSGTGYIEKAVFVPDFNHDFNHHFLIFCIVEHGLPISITISNTISILKSA